MQPLSLAGTTESNSLPPPPKEFVLKKALPPWNQTTELEFALETVTLWGSETGSLVPAGGAIIAHLEICDYWAGKVLMGNGPRGRIVAAEV